MLAACNSFLAITRCCSVEACKAADGCLESNLLELATDAVRDHSHNLELLARPRHFVWPALTGLVWNRLHSNPKICDAHRHGTLAAPQLTSVQLSCSCSRFPS